jgi:hypothetical protein
MYFSAASGAGARIVFAGFAPINILAIDIGVITL